MGSEQNVFEPLFQYIQQHSVTPLFENDRKLIKSVFILKKFRSVFFVFSHKNAPNSL